MGEHRRPLAADAPMCLCAYAPMRYFNNSSMYSVASGARILTTLIHELRRRGGGLGVAAICSGGGQGDAMILEVNGG